MTLLRSLISAWRGRDPLPRFGALGAGVVVLGLLVAGAVLAAGGGGEDSPPVVVATPVTSTPAATRTATPEPTVEPTVEPTPTPTPTAEPTETPTEEPVDGPPTVRTIRDLADDYGDPPSATFARFRIPALGVDAPVGTRSVGGDGVMSNPDGPADVVWYDLAGWDGYGGVPGSGGNAIFAGHVDYDAYVGYAGVDFLGRGVFFAVGQLAVGDVIEVDVNGETLRYSVQWNQQVNAATGDWAGILSGDLGVDSITLITCGGAFDFVSRSYEERIVVRAVRS